MSFSRAEVEIEFIAAGCNKVVNNVSWGASNLVSFGAQNTVAVFCPLTAQILTTLIGHTALVNCTQWLPNAKYFHKASNLQLHYLLSGDASGAIILWEFSLGDSKWRQIFRMLESHKKGVTCISTMLISKSEALFTSTSSDGIVCVWEFSFPCNSVGDYKLLCLDVIHVGSKPMVTLSLAELPGTTHHIILAMGGLDNKIHIYCGERTGKLVRVCELKGHMDWVRGLDFSLPVCTSESSKGLLLASSSQDKTIRLWKVTDISNASLKVEKRSLTSFIEGPEFTCGSFSYRISLESLLVGHEDWVYSVEWIPAIRSKGDLDQPMMLLSASMDKTMMIWKPDHSTGIWMNVVSVGELNHCALGFNGGHWSPNGDSILAHAYGGSFHLWKNIGLGFDNWKPQKVPSGHHGSVTDLEWARSGEYLVSVSYDQTTRIFSPWKMGDHVGSRECWHEISRPQIHGHDINCITVVRGNGNHRFVSGADEKVSRVFEAPLSFLKTLNHSLPQNSEFSEVHPINALILGANMSALGLSPKPIYVQDEKMTPAKKGVEAIDNMEAVPGAVPRELTEPPLDDQLSWHTLWPETHKLYGHGNELFSLCCDHKGLLLASACKAQTAKAAEIWLWDVASWKAVGRLASHNLTVTQMAFSQDDSLLLSVSRDRHFTVFSIQRTGGGEGVEWRVIEKKMAHKRIIWGCSWNPGGQQFATCSRDMTVKLWSVGGPHAVTHLLTLPTFGAAVTALSWLGAHRRGGVIVLGTEAGLIQLWTVSASAASASLLSALDPTACHGAPVLRLAWNSSENDDRLSDRPLRLASCGADHSVRVFNVLLL